MVESMTLQDTQANPCNDLINNDLQANPLLASFEYQHIYMLSFLTI
jgi:hypothetical protein